MDFLEINLDKCARDGICVAECPSRIIQLDPVEGHPRATSDAELFCLECGHCVAVCPQGALTLRWLGPDDCPVADPGGVLAPDRAEAFLRTRRSIRTFKDRPVERDKLEKLLEIACYAPSAKNEQPWHFIVVEQPGEVRRLAGMVIDWMRGFINSSPAVAENYGFGRVVEAWDGGYERICRGAPHVIVAHGDRNWAFGVEDCTLALDYLELYAPALGLGTCWAGYLYTAVNQYEPLSEALALPSHHRAYGAMMVGYPKYTYERFPPRRSPKVTWK